MRGRLSAGFTMIELITVIVLIGVLGAVGAVRFFDNTLFESKAYADQAKAVIRFAQKLAIAQNRQVYVRSEPAGFAVCLQPGCAAGGDLAGAPGGSNSGKAMTQAYCQLSSSYVANWMCEGRPANVNVASDSVRNEFAAGGYFSFDGMGRPYNSTDVAGSGTSTFGTMQLTFSSGANAFTVVIERETGYVHDL
ncbi:Tfp pilus assembly protein FimT/FimU [Duganella sp. Dugasp56]|uniref:pilus assembly FimT family protein n=1 Tax=Duganella sp. Dugasp56 TaxID=3243046 RepID=UPI0039AF4B9A